MGKARQGQKGLQQAREGKAQAQGVVAADERRILEEQRSIENDATAAAADLAERGLTADIDSNEATAASALARSIETARHNRAMEAPEDEWENITYWKPAPANGEARPKGGSDKITYQQHPNGTMRTTGKELLTTEQAESVGQLTPYVASATTGSKRPASLIKSDEERAAIQTVIGESIEKIDALAAEGKDSSGLRGLAMEYVPDSLKGLAENYLYEADEQNQRASNVFIDAQIKEAISTGVLSDQDIKRLAGLNIAAPGLTPEQQVIRLSAINDILSKSGVTLQAPPPGYYDEKPPSGRKSGRGSGARTGKAPPPASSGMTQTQTARLAELRKKRDEGRL
jgi:hypothetical protein